MQDLAVRVFPVTNFRHVGDLAWTWCLALDRADEHPTAVWTHAGRTLAWGWLELPGALMLQVDPGHPERSVLLERMSKRGRGQMPPLATSLVDDEAVRLLRAWIESLQ